MGSFEIAVDKVFWLEGGYVNDPADPGGETIYGITKRDHPDLWANGQPTKEQAKERYKRDYWNPLWEQLSQPIASELLETCVVMGVKNGVLCLQKALNRFGQSLTADGSFGSKTLFACSLVKEDSLLRDFRVEQIIRAIKLAEEKPELKKFVRQWIWRAIA